jgi:hypothetical protein
LAGIPLQQKGGDEIYTDEMTQKTYERLLSLGMLLASQGFAVILDAKYDRASFREDAIASAKSQQIPLQILHCNAPAEVLRERLQNRTGDIADATADLLEAQQAAAQAFTETEKPYVKTVDTTQALEPQLKGLGTRG